MRDRNASDRHDIKRALRTHISNETTATDILERAAIENDESSRSMQSLPSDSGMSRTISLRPASSYATSRTTSSSTVLRPQSRAGTETSSATTLSHPGSTATPFATKNMERYTTEPDTSAGAQSASHRNTNPATSTLSHPQWVSQSLSKPNATTALSSTQHVSKRRNATTSRQIIQPLPFVPTKSEAEDEASKLEATFVASARELDNTFRTLYPPFEAQESDTNWKAREQNVLKVRKITKGNAYDDYPTSYLANIKHFIDPLIKTVESLRTTLCSLGCYCFQDIIRRTGEDLDPSVEILFQTFLKMCSNTKKITSLKADSTIGCLLINVSFNARVAQHIFNATQDKNPNPRAYASGWIHIVLTKYGHQKHVIEHNNALELISKAIKAGLNDREIRVRSPMRKTYWTFARLWSDKAERQVTDRKCIYSS